MGNTGTKEDGEASFLKTTTRQILAGNAMCGNIFDAYDEDEMSQDGSKPYRNPTAGMILPGELCHSTKSIHIEHFNKSESIDEATGKRKVNPTSALFARALISEVTDNPRTMPPEAMAAREKRLLKAQERARRQRRGISALAGVSPLGGLNLSFANATAAGEMDTRNAGTQHASILPPNQLSENRAQLGGSSEIVGEGEMRRGKHTITIGLSLSRRHSTQGHPDTVTRQTAFDFNELQDRSYKYVSSTDSSGWRAGGGEVGGNPAETPTNASQMEDALDVDKSGNGHAPNAAAHKVAAPDTVHIPIIHIDAASPAAVDQIIAALARGEVFIPHMSILPEALSVNGVSPPDLVVRFGCERNDDLPPDEWPNWCLEFMHNQLYEYFLNAGARWTKRPFQITLAKKVRWRTVKHMNKFFAHSERVINAWREKGPQYLNPQLSYIEGGATPEEVARPHGIYLLRNGRPTNYFPPNFEPPYTTKMTRSLLMNVIGNSWDKKRRDWTSEPIPRVITPAMLIATVCGCGDGGTTGFIAGEEDLEHQSELVRESLMKGRIGEVVMNVNQKQEKQSQQQQQQQQKQLKLKQEQPQHDDLRLQDSSKENDNINGNKEKKTDHNVLKKSMSASSNYSQESDESRGIHIEQQPPSDSNVLNEGQSTFTRPKQNPINVSKDDPFDDLDDNYDVGAGDNETRKNSLLLSPKNLRTHNRKTTSSDEVEKGKPASIVESATTIPISNQWGKTNSDGLNRDLEVAKRLGELEDAMKHQKMKSLDEDHFFDSEEEQIKEKKLTKAQKKEKKEREKREKKEKKRRDKEREREKELERLREKELSREEELRQLERERELRIQQEKELEKAQEKDSINGYHTQSKLKNGRSNRSHRNIQSINTSPSNHSLDYSVDTASIATGHYTVEGSVNTTGTAGNQSLLSYVTRSTVHTQGSDDNLSRKRQQLEDLLHEDDEEDDVVNTEGIASMEDYIAEDDEEVPSDEDLFAIGWAKALDENSGSYYYFTLDRSTIVWENPLTNEEITGG